MNDENPSKLKYFVNLDQIEYLIQKTNNKFYWIFNNENKYITNEKIKRLFNEYLNDPYKNINYKSKLIAEIMNIIQSKKEENNNYIYLINEKMYYPLYLINKYIGMEYALHFLNITYIIPINNNKIGKKYIDEYSIKCFNIDESEIIKLNIEEQLNTNTIYKDTLDSIFNSIISNMCVKNLFLGTDITKICKKWTNQNNIHLIQYLKNELNKMPNSSFIKYIWLNTAIQECIKFDKNLYIIYRLMNRLIQHKYRMMFNNLDYFEIFNRFDCCENNTIKICNMLDKKIELLFKTIFN